MVAETMREETYDTLADEIAGRAERLRRSNVQVRTGREGGGSGVIWRPDGLIITNAHVARRDRAEVELSDGRVFEGEVTARDVERDLAALRVPAGDLPAAEVGDSADLRVGQLVLAVGNPWGMVGAVTLGIVHAIAPAEGRRRPLVQADIHLAPGNSGGPLADVRGRVIGINAMVGGGLGLAVPSNDVGRFLRDGGAHPQIGTTMQPVTIKLEGRQRLGLMVLELAPSGPALESGITLGDILIGAGGRAFEHPRDLATALREAGAGGTIRLELVRGGHLITLDVVLPGLPDEVSGAAA